MKRIILIAAGGLAIIALALWAFTGGKPNQTSNDKLTITTSFYPLYFFTKSIVADRADVYNITPSGAEPHDYELTTGDQARIYDSALLVLNGVKLEAWGGNITNNLRGSSTKVISVGDQLANSTISENGILGRDPHVWLDPALAKKMVGAITEAIIQIDPQGTEIYQANSKNLISNLSILDEEFRTGLSNCQQKNIVTSHSAFGYLAKEYGLNQISVAGLSPDAEPSADSLAKVADFARKNNIKYIFFESLVSPKLAQTVAREVGAQTMVLNPLEGLTSAEIATGKNYFTEMERNLKNLKTALGCR